MSYIWDASGFKGPYRLIGLWQMPGKSLLEANPDAYRNAFRDAPRFTKGGVGSCAVCGTGIIWHYIVKDANSDTFPVGCDCILDKNLKESAKALQKAHRASQKAIRVRNRLEAERLQNGGLTVAAKLQKEHEEAGKVFYAQHQELFDAVKGTQNAFALTVLQDILQWRKLSDKQADLLKRLVKEHQDSLTATNEFWGEIGQVYDFTLECVKVLFFTNVYGTTVMSLMKDKEGRTFKYSGNSAVIPKRGEVKTFRAKIKEHVQYQETMQTVLAFPKAIK